MVERSGGFDPSLPVQENIEFNLRLYLDGARFVYVDTVGLVYRNDRRGFRQTDRETYVRRELLDAVQGLVRTLASRDALTGELADSMFTMALDAGRTSVAHGGTHSPRTGSRSRSTSAPAGFPGVPCSAP